MATYTVTLSDAEIRAMEHVCLDADDWIQHAFQHRIYTAMIGLSDLEIAKAIKAQREIVTDRERLVELSDEPPMAEWTSEESYNPDPNNPFVNPVVKLTTKE
jgi:hypothetical protein